MRTRLRLALVPGIGFGLACVALLAAGWPADPAASSSFCPVTVDRCGGVRREVEVTMSSSFTPTKLPKRKLAPVHLKVEGTIGMADGSNPPPLRELTLEIDRDVAFGAQGLPACGLKKLKEATTSQALKVCPRALVGEGKTNVEVAYPEQSPHPLLPWSKLLAFYGGVKGGKPTVYLHSYLATPVSAPVVMTARISKIQKGRYGPKLAISIPVIANGSGFVREFQLGLFRLFTHRGRKRSFVKARCFDGKLLARATLTFSEGALATSTFLLPCIARG